MHRQFSASLLRVTHPSLCRHLKAMADYQWLDPGIMQEMHNRKLSNVLRHAIIHVPRYRLLAASRSWVPEDLSHESLSEFPMVDKRTMAAEQESFLADDAAAQDRVADATGGSSGILFRYFYDRRTKEIRRATDFYSRMLAGWRPGDPIAVVWGHRGDVAVTQRLRGRMVDAILYRRITLNAHEMNETVLKSYVAQLESHRPRIIVGFSSSLGFVAEYLSHHGNHRIRPAGIISSAETLDEERRKIIESQFGCPVFNRYGSREFANVAQQCEQGGGLHIFTDRIHVEVVRPDGTPCLPGESGEIVITDLINAAMPFIRYRTGDIGSFSAELCSCGRGMPLLAKVEGRTSEILVGNNGRYCSCPGPLLFGAGIPGIGQMQVIQDHLGALEVKIVPDSAWSEESRHRLVARVQELLGDLDVTVTLTDRIPTAPSGKYLFAISKVSPFVAQGS